MKFKYFSMLIKILPGFVINRLFTKGSPVNSLKKELYDTGKCCLY